MMSVPRPAIFVATVTEPFRPAWATIAASRSWFLAFNTSCGMPRFFSKPLKYSDLSTEVVPTKTGWPFSCRANRSSTTAINFASSVL